MADSDPLAEAIAKATGQDPNLRLRAYVRQNLADIEKKSQTWSFEQIAKGLDLLGVRDSKGNVPTGRTLAQAVMDERKLLRRRRLRGSPQTSTAPAIPKHPSKIFE